MPTLHGPRTVRQNIGLRPMGNTVTVELASDNPFESAHPVEVYTQVSGGIAPADRRMRSRKVHTPVMSGHNALFAISGLGEDAPAPAAPAAPSTSFWGGTADQQAANKQAAFNAGLSTVTSVAQGVIGTMVAKQQAKAANIAAEGQSRILTAQAAAEQAAAMRAQAEEARLRAGKKPFPMVPVLISAGVLVALVATVIALKK
jgi:hypothetical protein